jgi:hypothetical protein
MFVQDVMKNTITTDDDGIIDNVSAIVKYDNTCKCVEVSVFLNIKDTY